LTPDTLHSTKSRDKVGKHPEPIKQSETWMLLL